MAEADDKKKYNVMEPVLQVINKNYVSLAEEDVKRNNNILKALIELIINKMKEKDNLFKEMYSRVFFGGSFYDGLRVGRPDEFDLDLLLTLPKLVEATLTTSNIPGYVHLNFKEFMKFMKQSTMVERFKEEKQTNGDNIPESHLRRKKNRPWYYGVKGLDKLIDDKHFLCTSKVLRWMESVVNLALNDFEKRGSEYILKTSCGVFYAKVCKGGPAFTLKVNGNVNGKIVILDVDLVPCFLFGKDKWPENGFRKNPIAKKPQFFIVPKPLKETSNSDRYWRLSFQEQEREIIDGKDTLKPSVKLLKKMRDNLDHKCISSYYLKTVILSETFEKRNEEFWNNPLSFVFMNVLKEYHNCLNKGEIKYFWNKNNNLIKQIKNDTMMNLRNRIKGVIDDIERHPEDPFVIAKYLLTKSELARFQTDMKTVSNLSNAVGRLQIQAK